MTQPPEPSTTAPQYGGQAMGPGQNQMPPQQPPYGGGYAHPTQPPKKRKKWPIVLLVLVLLFLLGIGGCVAIAGSFSSSVSKEIDKQVEKSAPREVTEGDAFTVGSHETLAGWKVVKDDSLGEAAFNVTGKVKNTSDSTSTAFVQFKFIDKSGEVLGNVSCNSADLEPGQTQALNCVLDGTYGKYTKITAEASF